MLIACRLKPRHGRAAPLSVDDLERLADCIPNSSIPEAIDTIVFSWD